ncbi:FIST signal transduction protein [Kiloniella sp. b19]|uniref:FIST signal transduction protein n=1 Tax=Kiloniella sp. GXU_MW_B19 TaxID=3141326 RepID=UPI0031E22562
MPNLRFASAFSLKTDWSQATLEVLSALEEDWSGASKGFDGATIGFVYASDGLSEELSSIITLLKTRTAISCFCGTVGLGIGVMGRDSQGAFRTGEFYDVPCLSVMIASLPDGAFQPFQAHLKPEQSDITEIDRDLAANLPLEVPMFLDMRGNGLADWLEKQTPRLSMIHADPRETELPSVFPELQKTLSCDLIGGLTSSRMEWPLVADTVQDGGFGGVILNDAVGVMAGLTQGCSAIGEVHRVTGVDGTMLTSLDGRPALDVLKEDVGELLARDLRRLGGYVFVARRYQDEERAGHNQVSGGDYRVHHLLGITVETGELHLDISFAEGDEIFFCRRDNQAARQDFYRMLDEMRSKLPSEPKGGIYISCIGRGRALFGPNSEEWSILNEELGSIPMVGFYASGEICGQQLYSYTGVLTLFY